MQLKFKKNSFKRLSFGSISISGRNNKGKIVVCHRGGGCKKKVRIIDFKKYIWNVFGFINRIEYDPKRNSLIALVTYSNGIITYCLATEGLNVGDFIINSEKTIIKSGNSTNLSSIPVGVRISSIELSINKGAQFIRAAGTYATVVTKYKSYCILKLKSGEMRKFPSNCLATVGVISNFQYMYRRFGKAGYYRKKGWLPIVRGVAMNPVDHPHGGGQGKTSGGRPSVTPKGIITKGKPTKKYFSPMIIRHRKF